jgi:PKD repeat protein
MTASPAALPRDGSSQSTVTVIARDESGEALPGIRLLASVSPGTTQVAQAEAVTGSDGTARFLLTAPTPSTVAADNQVVFRVTPLGGINDDFRNASARSVALGLLGPSNATYPSPSFVTTPEAPTAPAVVTFDASATMDEGVPCISCSYLWETSNGLSASGRFVALPFDAAGTYAVTLTVTDVTGTSNSIIKSIEVRPAAAEEEEGDGA